MCLHFAYFAVQIAHICVQFLIDIANVHLQRDKVHVQKYAVHIYLEYVYLEYISVLLPRKIV